MSKRLIPLILCLLTIAASLFAQRTTRIYGYVLDRQNVGIELVNVYLDDGVTGTHTNKNGYYTLSVPQSDTVCITFSFLGYTTLKQQVYTSQDVLNINVVMQEDVAALGEVEVRGIQNQQGMMDNTSTEVIHLMPDATGGSIESLLITFAGVNQNNELSTQYNVRGGSFDENSVYVNGIEIHRPLLIRSGQQEGLSFVNPDMVEKVSFSAGGFTAEYGDKMSSVLDIHYKRPTRIESSLSLSLLGANAYFGWGDSLHSQMHGIRYKTSKYMLGALPTKGNYQPTYLDYQTQMTFSLPQQWNMRFLGNFSLNNYTFIPDSESEGFGSYTQAMNRTIYYEGQEKDRFLTTFGALTASRQYDLTAGNKFNKSLLDIDFTVNGFYTREQETYDILSDYILSEQSLAGKPNTITANSEMVRDSLGSDIHLIAEGKNHEHARNQLQAGVVSLSHHGQWQYAQSTLSWGLKAQAELIHDRISEWEWRDSAGYSMPNDNRSMQLFYTLKGENTMRSARLEAYAQESYKWNTEAGNVIFTGGVRLNWWNYTGEVLVSPRANVVWFTGKQRDIALRFGTGLYYQSPFYKELRDTLTQNGITRIQLNDQLKAQRSTHAVLGLDYYFRAWGRPFKFTTELYAKYTDRMVSYTVENVRVRYSGKNDSRAYTLGADFKLYGELVPGVDSWISFSTMRSRMHMQEDTYHLGWFPTPQEQRWALTFFFQDYIPKFPQYRLHLKFIFSEGLPFGYPHRQDMRYLGHLSSYKRIDIGASRTFSAQTDKFMRGSGAQHIDSWSIYFEVFNIVGWKNVNSYYWISGADGNQWASPNYLTGRMFNLRLAVNLK
ncbi:MAG: carboxypeptidase-like regulatory domain-containing protein [Paludibacteraceae bacterium]|nr:carboxypeptidase-like regulatory domain-containing protein [Paludibacteraceae bacterium]